LGGQVRVKNHLLNPARPSRQAGLGWVRISFPATAPGPILMQVGLRVGPGRPVFFLVQENIKGKKEKKKEKNCIHALISLVLF
jgi:hypothetical protein